MKLCKKLIFVVALLILIHFLKWINIKNQKTHKEGEVMPKKIPKELPKDEEDELYSANMDLIMSKRVSRKYAVMSLTEVNNNTFYYSIYLPVCALAWRRIGYEPIVIFVIKSSTDTFSTFTNKTMEYLNLFKVKVFLVHSPPDYENHLSQLARLYVGLLPSSLVKENDFVLLADSDIIPVRKNLFQFYNTLSIVLVNGYGVGEVIYKGVLYEVFAISYMGMRKCQWREVMNVTKNMSLTGELVLEKASMFFGNGSVRKNNEIKKGDTHWDLDQKIVSIGIHRYVRASGGLIKLSKFRLNSRLDRYYSDLQWANMTQTYTRTDDCHLFHQDAEKRFNLTFGLLSKMFNKNICDVLLKYFTEFFVLLK
jgi:hypothetical protein